MRQAFTIIKGNLRKNKGSYISVAILMFVVSFSLVGVLSIMLNTSGRDKELIEKAGFGHIFTAIKAVKVADYDAFCDEIVAGLESCDDVERVDKVPSVFMDIVDLNGQSSSNSVMVLDYKSEYVHYNIYDEKDKLIEQPVINPGEISVPISFRTLFNCKIGDVITLVYDGKEYEYKIISYMEDPYMGSSLVGMKTVLMNEMDIVKIVEESESKHTTTVLSIFRKSSSTMNDVEFEAELNRKTSFSAYSWFALSRSQAYGYMTMLTDIFSGILIGFVAMLVVATLIVLSHNISNSIEHDYANIGILKAVGVSDGRLKNTIMLGYLIMAFIGALIGMIAAFPLIGIVNKLIRPAIGIVVDNTPQLVMGGLSLLAIFVVLALFIRLKLGKVSRITPVMAIRDNKKDVHFSSIFKLPISKKCLGFSLAYRQFITGKKQYVSAIIVNAILVMFMAMISNMCMWFGNGGENLEKMFSLVNYDIRVYANTNEQLQDIDSIIKEHTEAERLMFGSRYVLMNDIQIWCGVIDSPDRINNVYEGRTCLYDNEVLITEYVAENFGIGIGDSVEIKLGNHSEEFIVSGFYQLSNDLGKNITITEGGFKKLVDEYKVNAYCYILEDTSVIGDIAASISAKYDEAEAGVSEYDAFDGMDVIIMAINGIAVLVYVIAAVFVMVTVIMVCSKLFSKEKRDYGIFKSIGYTSARLRRQFALRFVFVAVFGAVVGIILTLIFSDLVIGSIFEMFGMANFTASLHISAAVLPILFMSLIYYVSAYTVSRKIKKVTPRVLIVE
ncbi:MAG: ABC transporter permease [Lachnospiraceae bacterium]|nr:ABC transporter permease [Lachnospiraceae bacterium]